MNKKLVSICFFFVAFVLLIFAPSSYATTFDLVPPTGDLVRGQDITFTININTEGASVSSIQSGLTYDATLLQYVRVDAGAAMNSVVADTTTYGTGKVLFTGTNNAGYTGTEVFATVVFTIIAQGSGQTEICSLWLPTPTNTPAPTSITATSPPQPTALPETGTEDSRNTALIFAISFIAVAGGVFYLSQKQKYSIPDVSPKKSSSKSKVHKKP